MRYSVHRERLGENQGPDQSTMTKCACPSAGSERAAREETGEAKDTGWDGMGCKERTGCSSGKSFVCWLRVTERERRFQVENLESQQLPLLDPPGPFRGPPLAKSIPRPSEFRESNPQSLRHPQPSPGRTAWELGLWPAAEKETCRTHGPGTHTVQPNERRPWPHQRRDRRCKQRLALVLLWNGSR